MHTCIHIYIYRERERDVLLNNIYIYISLSLYIYIYIYIYYDILYYSKISYDIIGVCEKALLQIERHKGILALQFLLLDFMAKAHGKGFSFADTGSSI